MNQKRDRRRPRARKKVVSRQIPTVVLPGHGNSETVPVVQLDPSAVVDDAKCFLCGLDLTGIEQTDEHVFPKWLLNRYKLWDSTLNLLNGTQIAYRQIKIPCCKDCNGKHLSILENRVERAVTAGFDEFVHLPDAVVYQWLVKIFLQILRLESRLPADRKKSKGPRVVDPQYVESLRVTHWLVSSVRRPVTLRLSDGRLWSIFRFRCQVSQNPSHCFDFMDHVDQLGIAIRAGDIGIVACLQDCGALWSVGHRHFLELQQALALHPIQFREVATNVFYKLTTMNRTPKFVIISDDKQPQLLAMPLMGLSGSPIFEDWDMCAYARNLSAYTQRPFEDTYRGDKVRTFLQDDQGEYLHIPLDESLK